MKTLGMQELRDGGNQKQYAENCSARFVEAGFKGSSVLAVESQKLIHSGARNSGSSTRATARTFSGANHSAVAHAHSLDLIWVNGSAVIATGSLSGKGMNFFAGNAVSDIHGVAGINLGDFMPANLVSLHGVDDDQTFIKENNFGMNENQVEDRVNHQTPSQSAEGVSPSVIDDVYIDQSAYCKEDAQTHDISTTWSEGFKVGHLVILSRNERRAA